MRILTRRVWRTRDGAMPLHTCDVWRINHRIIGVFADCKKRKRRKTTGNITFYYPPHPRRSLHLRKTTTRIRGYNQVWTPIWRCWRYCRPRRHNSNMQCRLHSSSSSSNSSKRRWWSKLKQHTRTSSSSSSSTQVHRIQEQGRMTVFKQQ